MSHRAQQIIDAMAANLGVSAVTLGPVFVNRSLSLSEVEREVPCISVNYGADTPPNALGASNLSFIDSLIEVSVTAYASDDNERSLLSKLLDARRLVAVDLLADRTQGLSFVIDTRYGGATVPETNSAAERLVGSLASTWFVHYRMNLLDPS